VSEAGDESADFADDVVQDQIGDIADITLELENTDSGSIVIGSADQNYWIVADVTDEDDDGEVTVEFNSYAAGSNASDSMKLSAGDDSVSVVDENGSFNDSNGDAFANQSLLDATEYDLRISSDDASTAYNMAPTSSTRIRSAHSRCRSGRLTARLSGLPQPILLATLRMLTTSQRALASTSPRVTKSSPVTTPSFRSEQPALEGALNESGLGDEVTLTLEHTNAGANEDPKDVNVTGANSAFIGNGDNDTYYYAIETGSNNVVEDRDYNANFTVNAGSEAEHERRRARDCLGQLRRRCGRLLTRHERGRPRSGRSRSGPGDHRRDEPRARYGTDRYGPLRGPDESVPDLTVG